MKRKNSNKAGKERLSIETIGNRIWDPSTIFMFMIALLLLITKLLSLQGVSVIHPVTTDVVNSRKYWGMVQ